MCLKYYLCSVFIIIWAVSVLKGCMHIQTLRCIVIVGQLFWLSNFTSKGTKTPYLHWSRQSFEGTNFVPLQPVHLEPCKSCYKLNCLPFKNLHLHLAHSSTGPVQRKGRCVQIFVHSKICPDLCLIRSKCLGPGDQCLCLATGQRETLKDGWAWITEAIVQLSCRELWPTVHLFAHFNHAFIAITAVFCVNNVFLFL